MLCWPQKECPAVWVVEFLGDKLGEFSAKEITNFIRRHDRALWHLHLIEVLLKVTKSNAHVINHNQVLIETLFWRHDTAALTQDRTNGHCRYAVLGVGFLCTSLDLPEV
ncbi:hypothetical protein D3C84_646590 [compost metagenome]